MKNKYENRRTMASIMSSFFSIFVMIFTFIKFDHMIPVLTVISINTILWTITYFTEFKYKIEAICIDKDYDIKEDNLLAYNILFCMASLLFNMVVFIIVVLHNELFNIYSALLVILVGINGTILSEFYNIRKKD